MLPTSRTGSRLFRFLLLLVVRLRLSVRRTASALGARFTPFWKFVLTFVRPRCRGRAQIPLHASDVPEAGVDNDFTGRRLLVSEAAAVEEGNSETLAALPVLGTARRDSELAEYRALTEIFLMPTTPEMGSQRYESRTIKQRKFPLSIPAGQQIVSSGPPQPPEGWKRYVHPEGCNIFFHEGLRIFAESNKWQLDEHILSYARILILMAKQKRGVVLDELTELVVNVDENRKCHYYFVDHRHRILFWLEEVDPYALGADLQGVSEHSHIRYWIEAQYCILYTTTWKSRTHCEYYPHNRVSPKGVLDDLRGRLIYAKTDMVTADLSTSPFTQDELATILDVLNSLKDDERVSDTYSIWVIARLMSFFIENQFLHFHGQPCARLNADTPLFGQQTWDRGNVFKVVNVFLLGSPNELAIRLKRVWVDDIIIRPRWRDFVNKYKEDLSRGSLLSTVLLAVDISFLAVPGVVSPGTPANSIQIITYCSVVSTIGSIMFAFLLLNVYSEPTLLFGYPAAEVMLTLGERKWGMACLAIAHSLPIACLAWSIALFSVALAIQIFKPRERGTVAALGVECFTLVAFGFISWIVMRLFSKIDDADGVVNVREDDLSRAKSREDSVEQGLARSETHREVIPPRE